MTPRVILSGSVAGKGPCWCECPRLVLRIALFSASDLLDIRAVGRTAVEWKQSQQSDIGLRCYSSRRVLDSPIAYSLGAGNRAVDRSTLRDSAAVRDDVTTLVARQGSCLQLLRCTSTAAHRCENFPTSSRSSFFEPNYATSLWCAGISDPAVTSVHSTLPIGTAALATRPALLYMNAGKTHGVTTRRSTRRLLRPRVIMTMAHGRGRTMIDGKRITGRCDQTRRGCFGAIVLASCERC